MRKDPPITLEDEGAAPLVNFKTMISRLGLSAPTAYKLVKAGVIPGVRLDRRLWFDMRVVRRALAARPAAADS